LFNNLFPLGLAGEDLMEALAPNGWDHCELRFHHPSLEQAYADFIERKAWLKAHFRDLPQKTKQKVRVHYEAYDKIPFEYSSTPYKPEEELKEMVGRCLWDIFSYHNWVIKKKAFELGSFAGSAKCIDLFDRPQGNGRHYTKYYMGSVWIKNYVDLSPVYRLLFSRLKALECLWIYGIEEPGLATFDWRKKDRQI
jgi:hypothetical protein